MTSWSVCLFVCRGQGQRQKRGHSSNIIIKDTAWSWSFTEIDIQTWLGCYTEPICLQLPLNLSPEGHQGWHTGKWDERHKNHMEMTLSESLDPVDLKASPSQTHKSVNSLSWWKLGLCHLRLKTSKHNVQILSGGDTNQNFTYPGAWILAMTQQSKKLTLKVSNERFYFL